MSTPSTASMMPTVLAVNRGRQSSSHAVRHEKKKRADFVVDTGGTIENCNSQIDLIVAKLRDRQGRAYDLYWRG